MAVAMAATSGLSCTLDHGCRFTSARPCSEEHGRELEQRQVTMQSSRHSFSRGKNCSRQLFRRAATRRGRLVRTRAADGAYGGKLGFVVNPSQNSEEPKSTDEGKRTLETWKASERVENFSFGEVVRGVCTMVGVERAAAVAVQFFGLPCPSPVLVLAAVGVTMALNNSLSHQLYDYHAGAVAFFDTWLPMFFVPSVAGIVLAPSTALVDIIKGAIILGASYAFNLWGTAKLVAAIEHLMGSQQSNNGSVAAQVRPVADVEESYKAVSNMKQPSLLTKRLAPEPSLLPEAALLAGTALLAPLLLIPSTQSNSALMIPGFLLLTIGLFTNAKRLPPHVRKWLSPTVVAGTTIAALCAAYSSTTLSSWRLGIRLYKEGAGAILAALIGPAVAALGFKVHTQRELLQKSVLQLLLACVVIVPSGLVATAVIGRLLGASPVMTLSLVPATTTLGLAFEMVPLLQANRGLVVAGVTIAGTAGISTARQLMAHWKVDGAVSRGMAVGASSHTLGASAIAVDEPQAAAVAGLTLALKGTLSVLAVTYPPFRDLLLSIAQAN